MNTTLLSKYDIAAPRYTSYPTVPYWTDDQTDPAHWLGRVENAFRADPNISLYLHLPFCESLCTYCGCNKHITKNHAVEQPYLEALLQEWRMYLAVLPGRPVLQELHLGGGTPTFFHPDHLKRLLETILADVTVPPGADYSFEAHPNSTTREHLAVLHALGFRRVSIGVQDFDLALMTLVNRRQTPEEVERCTLEARELGYASVNYDLIFGLPRQTPAHIERSADYLERLRPDRIAFYSYAHVPWLKRSQCAYSEEDLPVGADKRLLYETGRVRLEAMGYREIGMDHFALPHDALAQAMDAGTMHRNFMGYTTRHTRLMIGLGASAIGDTWDAFAQNVKTVAEYETAVHAGRLPVFRGHRLDAEDQRLRKHILRLMTRFETNWELSVEELRVEELSVEELSVEELRVEELSVEELSIGPHRTSSHPIAPIAPNPTPQKQDAILGEALERLQPMAADGLVEIGPNGVKVTEAGRTFLRNICLAFDAHYWRRQPAGQLFSKTV